MGTVTNVVIDQTTGKISVILVTFDNEHVGQEASFQATSSQFPLTLAWAVTIHKCKGLTLSEIVIDMTHAKGKFKPGEACVAFSRVKMLEKLHIINYT